MRLLPAFILATSVLPCCACAGKSCKEFFTTRQYLMYMCTQYTYNYSSHAFPLRKILHP